jgi:hypothetical protein
MLSFLCVIMMVLGLLPLGLYVIRRGKDPFNPLILVGAASFFVSAYDLLTKPGPALAFFDESTYSLYVLIAILSLLGFYAGWYVSRRRDRATFNPEHKQRVFRPERLIAIAGFSAVVANIVFVITHGDAQVTGYLRDWGMLWVAAAIIAVQVIASKPNTTIRMWAWIVLGIAIISPVYRFFDYGQRGDTIRLALIASVFYLVWRTRPYKPAFIAAAVVVALTLATLHTTRAIVNEDPTKNRITALAVAIPHFLKEKPEEYESGREFIFGTAIVKAAHDSGIYGYGKAFTIRLIARFAPKELFPDKWEWMGAAFAENFIRAKDEAGVVISGGAAISGAAEGYAELSWFFPIIWFIFGFFHQKLWFRAIYSTNMAFTGYVVAYSVAMVYGILQDVNTAQMNMIYVLAPLYFIYKACSAPVHTAETMPNTVEAPAVSLA